VLIYYGSGNNFGIGPGPSVTLWGENTGDQFGWSVAGVGDVSGDGIPDLLVGAPSHAPGGKAYVYYGGAMPGGIATSAAWAVTETQSGSQFGFSVSGGRVNPNPTVSLIVGEPYWSFPGMTHNGSACFWTFQPGSLPGAAIRVSVGASNDHVGYSVACLQGLLYTTPGCIVGAPNSSVGGTVTGWVYSP
jgi:hypothetical protein